MQKILALSIFILISNFISAINITGKLIDSNTFEPIEFASIILLDKDSTLISNTQSDIKGKFTITGDFFQKDYILKIKYIGYNTNLIALKNLSRDIDLGEIDLITTSYEIGEIAVTTNKIINKIDRQVILPSSMEVESSTNGFDLLSKMYIPGLKIDPVNRTITAQNQTAQIRINGIKATIQDLSALRTQDVSRVEYFEDPGVRFGNEDVGAVINLIVKRDKQIGGYIAIGGRNSTFVTFGDDQISLKINNKASQFSLDYEINYRGLKQRWTDITSEYNFPDNKFTQIQIGDKQPRNPHANNISLSYNVTHQNKYIFNVSLRDSFIQKRLLEGSKTSYSNSKEETYIYKDELDKSASPSLDIYYRRELKNRQSLTFNVVGTYIITRNNNSYEESQYDILINSIKNNIVGEKYSIIAEALYNKEFESLTFTTGAKHTQGYANNKYTGTNNITNNMQNTDSYIYAQIQGKIKEIKYSLGLSGSRIWFKEDGKSNTYYMARPSLQLSYPINDNLNIRYSFNVNSSIPSLAQLSDVEQQVDSFTVTRGNPNLKPYNTYANKLTFGYEKSIFNIQLIFTHSYMNKPFMKVNKLYGNKILSYIDNYKSFNKMEEDIDITARLIKDIWTINTWIGSEQTRSNAEWGSNNYTSLYWGVHSNLIYKNYTLVWGFKTRYNTLWGETISYGEKWSYIELGYKYKEAKLALSMALPFDKYWSIGSKNLSKIAPSESWTYIKENAKMIYFRFSWNFSFGRKHNAGQKSLQNSDSDTGILR